MTGQARSMEVGDSEAGIHQQVSTASQPGNLGCADGMRWEATAGHSRARVKIGGRDIILWKKRIGGTQFWTILVFV